jgi:hypothetical protein
MLADAAAPMHGDTRFDATEIAGRRLFFQARYLRCG